MADPTQRVSDLRNAYARLTGSKAKRRNHVEIYRLTVVTKDGQDYGLRLSLGNNLSDPPKSQVSRLKRKLCLVDHDIDVVEVLGTWTPNDLKEYIEENLTRADLERYPGG